MAVAPDGDLRAAFDAGWALLEEGARSRRSPMHTPVLASIDAGGLPTQRVLVLRAAERGTARLRFHTDARSPKVAQIGDGAAVHVLAYHPEARIQLRLSGTARVEREGEAVDAVWAGSTLFARRCYLAEGAPGSLLDAPGSGLPAWVEGREPDADAVRPARGNFALLFVDVTAMDWLHLANSGHRRARFARDGGGNGGGDGDGWRGQWLLP